MRAPGLTATLLLAACSDSSGTGNSVDVSAAASRAETDIANYAAVRAAPRRPLPTAISTPVSQPRPTMAAGGPVRAEPRQVAPARP